MSAQITTENQNPSAFHEFKYNEVSTTTQVMFYDLKNFLFWWYIQMPFYYFSALRRFLIVVDDRFSITLLIKTFFIPWHRDYHAVGFFMGIMVRIVYIPIALAVFLTMLLAYLAFILLWLLLPIATLSFILLTPFIN